MFVIGFIFGFLFGCGTVYAILTVPYQKTPLLTIDNPDTWKLVRAENCPKDRFYAILTVETSKGTRKFRGKSTVWMDLEKFHRCSTDEEAALSDLWEEAKKDI